MLRQTFFYTDTHQAEAAHDILNAMDKNPNFLPIIIVVAGVLIAASIFFVRSNSATPMKGDLSQLRPVSTADHLVGNPEAAVIIVEYSDIDCQYCKQFHEALEQVMADYGTQGNLAWVYRHFPLIEAHPHAAAHAEAAECVASLGNPDLFFRFIDALHQAAPDANQFDPTKYGPVVTSLGVSVSDFQTCIEGSKFEKRVADDFDNAVAIGAGGAPYSVILIKGHEPIPVSGALPYQALKKIIDAALEKAATPSN